MKKQQKPHHPVRTLIEFLAVIALIVIIYTQRETIYDAIKILPTASLTGILLSFGVIWFTFPFSARLYYLLSPKPLPRYELLLTHLAGAGLGRVVPGGLGLIGIGTLYLKKKRLKLKSAISIAVSSNLITAVAHSLILVFCIGLDANTSTFVTTSAILFGVFGSIVLVSYYYYRTVFRPVKKSQLLIDVRRIPFALLFAATIPILRCFSLVFASYALGMPIHFTEGFIALSVGVGIGSVIPTPGGIGSVEFGIAITLIAFGYPADIATAVSVIYWFASYIQPIAPGTVAYFYLRNRNLL